MVAVHVVQNRFAAQCPQVVVLCRIECSVPITQKDRSVIAVARSIVCHHKISNPVSVHIARNYSGAVHANRIRVRRTQIAMPRTQHHAHRAAAGRSTRWRIDHCNVRSIVFVEVR